MGQSLKRLFLVTTYLSFQLISYATPITFLTPCLLAALIWMTSAWQDDPCVFRSVEFEVLLQCTHELKKMIVICYSKHRTQFLWVEILKFKNLIEQIRNYYLNKILGSESFTRWLTGMSTRVSSIPESEKNSIFFKNSK